MSENNQIVVPPNRKQRRALGITKPFFTPWKKLVISENEVGYMSGDKPMLRASAHEAKGKGKS